MSKRRVSYLGPERFVGGMAENGYVRLGVITIFGDLVTFS